jgi:AcrR family transcriptional regulator
VQGRRERRKQEIRGRITEAALDLFDQKLCEDTTIDEICEKADVARKTFYNYYPSKQDLIDELMQSVFVAESRNMIEMSIEKYDTTEQRLDFVFDQMRGSLNHENTFQRNLVLQSITDMSANPGKSGKLMFSYLEVMRSLFESDTESQGADDHQSARSLGEAAYGMVNMAILLWIHDENYPIDTRFAEIKDILKTLVLTSQNQ